MPATCGAMGLLNRFLLVAATLSAVLLVFISGADACACCDGSGERTLVGWSASGRSAMIEHQYTTACEPAHALEVWPVRSQAPSHCFDLQAEDPDARTACDALTFQEDARQAGRTTPGASTRQRFYPQAGRLIKSQHLVARLSPLPIDSRPDDDVCMTRRHRLTVTLRGAPRHTLVDRVICVSAPDDVGETLG
ncbi:MAG: hypothetical protein JRH11_26415, partial [Deltaproteobacteria bacterium]|nr:hypothetical protein [Deltaproteobacteria bacterium]